MNSTTATLHSSKKSKQPYSIKKVSWVVALGVLLNPLNSSMISVALLDIRTYFDISIATVTWLVSCFYLAATVFQPLMGKLADLFGPRRIFSIGISIVILSSILSVWAPSFEWLIVFRVLQALGTTSAFPAGLAIIRNISRDTGNEAGSTSSLGLISITANVMAAFGPTLGGFLVAYVGWISIFWINIPVALFVLILALRWMPGDPTNKIKNKQNILKLIDILGILLFSGMFTSLMFFLSSLEKGPQWWLLSIVPITAILFVLWELKIKKPFLDIRVFASNIKLISVFAQFAGLNIVFYALFFGLPLWLGQVRGYDPEVTGLLMLPFAGIGVLTTPIAVRMIGSNNYRPTIIIGSIVLVIGTLLLLILGPSTPVVIILLVAAVIGIPNGLNNMGLSTALYSNTNPEDTGVASGLFQTFRSIGSILSTSLLGLTFGGSITTEGLHLIAIITTVISLALLIVSLSRKLT